MADIPFLLPDVLATGESAVDQIVLSLENAGGNPELKAAIAARSLLMQGNYAAIRSVYERLSQTSPDRADLFLALGVKVATVRMDNGRPQSHLIAVPVATNTSLTLTKNQARTLADLVNHSGLVCKEAKVFFHPISIHLENLTYAGPVALWHAHHQIPAGKELSPEFWQDHPETTEPPLQTFLGVVESPSTGENCLHWEDFGEVEMVAFSDKASSRLFRRKYLVTPPMLLFDTLDPHVGDEPDPEEVFQDLLDQTQEAISELGTDELNAYIEEPLLTSCCKLFLAQSDRCATMAN